MAERIVGFYSLGRGRRRRVHPLTTREPTVKMLLVRVAPTEAKRHKRVWVISEHQVIAVDESVVKCCGDQSMFGWPWTRTRGKPFGSVSYSQDQ